MSATDDFDDALNDFSEPAKSTAAAGPSTAPAPDPADPVDLESEDFLAEFTRNMRALLSEQPEAPAAPREAPEGGATHEATEPLSKDEEDKIRKYFTEALEKDFGLSGLEGEPGAANNPGAGISEQDLQDVLGMVDGRFKGPEPSTSASSQPGASQKTGPARPDSFQDTLRATAERLKASEQSARQASASNASGAESQPDLARLLASLGGGQDLPGEDDEEGMQNALELMMGQLMSKELLYEPMADLKARYPEYLKEHGSNLSEDDRARYEKQNALVNQIVAVFDRPNYSDEDAGQKEEVVSLMTQMQECGTPPKEMMGDLPPGLDFGTGSMPDLDSCPTS